MCAPLAGLASIQAFRSRSQWLESILLGTLRLPLVAFGLVVPTYEWLFVK